MDTITKALIVTIPTFLAASAYAKPMVQDTKYEKLQNGNVNVSTTVKPSSPSKPVTEVTLSDPKTKAQIAKRPSKAVPKIPENGKIKFTNVSTKGRDNLEVTARAEDGENKQAISLGTINMSGINPDAKGNTANPWKFSMEDELKGGYSWSKLKFTSLPGRWPAGSTSTTDGFDGYARIRPSFANNDFGGLLEASIDVNSNTTKDDFGEQKVSGLVWDAVIGPQIKLSKDSVAYFLAGINAQNFKFDEINVPGMGIDAKLGADFNAIKTRFEVEYKQRKGDVVSPLINYSVNESEFNVLAQTGILDWARATFRLQNYDEASGVNTTSYILAFDKNLINDWLNVEVGGSYTAGKDANLENRMSGPGIFVNIGSQNIFKHLTNHKKNEAKSNQNYKGAQKTPQKTAPNSGK